MNRCPFFEKCGGCKFDFTAPDYRDYKLSLLKNIPITDDAIWIAAGNRRRGDFAFSDGKFGFFERASKNIITIDNCPILTPQLNKILPRVASMPWVGSGSVLITECENGIDIAVNSNVPYFTSEFKNASDDIDAIRITWNDKVVKQTVQPIIKFDDVSVDYATGAFLQPSNASEGVLRKLVVDAVFNDLGPGMRRDDKVKVADLFCGLGSFTFALNADGFDVMGGTNRDLFKNPLTVQNLKKYDCVVLDPPRAGAYDQCKELAKSTVKKIIYVSCNPDTFMRDKAVLEKGGFVLESLTPVDQFVGSNHWELVCVFKNQI